MDQWARPILELGLVSVNRSGAALLPKGVNQYITLYVEAANAITEVILFSSIGRKSDCETGARRNGKR